MSIKTIVRKICISSCEGKYLDRDNANMLFLKSQRGSLRVQWKQYKLSECKRIFPATCKPTYKLWWNQWRNKSYCSTFELNVDTGVHKKKDTHSVRAKNADCTCIHSTKNKVQRWALWLSSCTYTFQTSSQGMRLHNFEFLFNAFWFSYFFGLN